MTIFSMMLSAIFRLSSLGSFGQPLHPRQIRLGARIIALVPTENLLHPICHDNPPGNKSLMSLSYARPWMKASACSTSPLLPMMRDTR